MCNPRRLEVRLTRAVTQAWEEQIARTARLAETITGEARTSVPLMDSFGEETREAFERAIASDRRWESIGGGYRINVDGGHAYYYPESGEIEIVISITDCIEVVEERLATLHEDVQRTVEATRQGTYYTDGYAGLHHDRVQADLTTQAERDLDEQARDQEQQLLGEARQRVQERIAAEAARLQQEAEAAAAANLEARRQDFRAALEAEARARLEGVRASVMTHIHRLVGEALVAMARALAASGRAQNLVEHVDERGVVTLQFVMERN
jgi:hypothetical protein